MAEPEVILPFSWPAGNAPSASAVRSTLLVSSIQTLRARGHFDGYYKHLSERAQQDILSLIAGTWVPIELALEHYAAADALGLSQKEVEAIGSEVAGRMNKSVLATILRASREVGASPWTLFAQLGRFRETTWKGSDMGVWKVGPKDARIEWTSLPLAASRYFVSSFCGYLQGGVGLFCSRAYAKYVPDSATRGSRIIYRVSWT